MGLRDVQAKAPWVGQDGIPYPAETYDKITATAAGQTVFNLAKVPHNPYAVRMVPRGGPEQFNGLDFTVNGPAKQVTFIAPVPGLDPGDEILFTYFE